MATSPLAIVIDDAQWLDESTAAFVEYLADERPAGLLLSSAAAPTTPACCSARTSSTTPSRSDRSTTTSPSGSSGSGPSSINPRVAAASSSVPAGTRCSCVALVDAVHQRRQADLPTTVEDALRAELDRLGSRVRWLLGQAAVLGMRRPGPARAVVGDVDRRGAHRARRGRAASSTSAGARTASPTRSDAMPPTRRCRCASAARPTPARRPRSLERSDDPPAQFMSLHYFESGQHDASWVVGPQGRR